MANAIAKPDFSFGATFIMEAALEKSVEEMRKGEVGAVTAISAVLATDIMRDGPEEEGISIF